MKKVISLILCLALFVSVLGVTALATTDNYIVHYRLEKAILTSCFCTGTVHAVDARSVQRSDVDVQTAADGGDILDILRFIGHDRACAACQQNIGDIVYCNVICDVVYERGCFSDIVKTSA